MNSFFRKNVVIGAAELVCRLPLIFTVGVLARSVGTEAFGNWALILVLQVFVAGMAGLGLSSALSRYVPAAPPGDAGAYLRYAFALCTAVLIAASVVIVPLHSSIGALLGVRQDLVWLVPFAVLLAAGSVADGLLDAYFKARMAVGRQVVFIMSRTLAEIVAVVLVFVSPIMAMRPAAQQLAAYALVVAIGKLTLYPWLVAGMPSGPRFPPLVGRQEFVRYGLPMVPTVLALWMIGQSDRLVLSHFVSKHDLGLYAFAATFAGYIIFLGYAVYPLLLPEASRLYDEGRAAALQSLFNNAQAVFVPLWAGCMACLALWSGKIIDWTGGQAFEAAAPILLILAFAVGFERLMGVYQYVFHLKKRTDLIFGLNLANAGANIVALVLAGRFGGIAEAAWAVLAATIVFNLSRYALALRHISLRVERTLALRVAAVALLTFLLARLAAEEGVVFRILLTAVTLLPLAGFSLKRRGEPLFEASK